MLRKNYEWDSNAYEPGLFTFYVEQQKKFQNRKNTYSCSPEQPQESTFKIKNSKQNKSQILIKQQPDHPKKSKRFLQTIFASSHNKANRQVNYKCEQVKSLLQKRKEQSDDKIFVEIKTFRRTKNHQPIEIKENNLNKFFNYDVEKNKHKMFIFQKDFRKISRVTKHTQPNQPQQKPEKIQKYLSTKKLTRYKTEVETNPEMQLNSLIRRKQSFLQFLVENRRKTQMEHKKKEEKEKKIEGRCSNIIKFNKPKLVFLKQEK